MDLLPLHEALFATDDEIKQGFIDALIGAFEQRASWHNLFFMSSKGGKIFGQRTFAAIGKVLRSIEDEETAQKLSAVASNVGKGEVKFEPVKVAEMSRLGCSSHQLSTFSKNNGGSSSGGSKGPGSVSEMGAKSGLGRAKKPKSQSFARPRPNYYPKMIPRVYTAQMRRIYGIGAK